MVAAHRPFVQQHPVATKRALRALLKATDVCAVALIGSRRTGSAYCRGGGPCGGRRCGGTPVTRAPPPRTLAIPRIDALRDDVARA